MTTASGLLKKEMELFDSLILKEAYNNSVPAGNALAVDREKFSNAITKKIKSYKNVNFISREVESLPDGIVIVATGPLTMGKLNEYLANKFNFSNLYFYDASSPIVEAESIDMISAFVKDRYDKGSGDYINCPMNKEEYLNFYNELVFAKKVELKNFEKKEIFEGCMPIEVMANRGVDSLRFGPLKPVGLDNPVTKQKYYAVVQLRKEDNEGKLYNLVGFQTNLTFSEQKRVFSLIPALKSANFVKYGVMHRNTYINAPQVIDNSFRAKNDKNIFFAGQLSGVEGYMESTMSGLIAGINAYLMIENKPLLNLSSKTMIGAIINYITQTQTNNFQPMNANFGIVTPLDKTIKDGKLKKQELSKRALEEVTKIVNDIL